MQRGGHVFLLFTLMLFATTGAAAEAPVAGKIEVQTSVNVPRTGLSMRQVEKQYGKPKEIVPGVGTPAITRWVYDDFTVYFEDRLVVHSVVPGSLRARIPEPPPADAAATPAPPD